MGFSLDFILKVFTSSSSNAKLSLARSAVISFTAGPRELCESLIITNKPITTAMTTKELTQIMITMVTGKFSLSVIASDGSEKRKKIHKLQWFWHKQMRYSILSQLMIFFSLFSCLQKCSCIYLLNARVYEANTSDSWEIPWNTTQERCITT